MNNKKESMIFTKTEQEEFEIRLQGKKHNYKIWYRVKPKLFEILELFKRKKEIEEIVKKQR